jgi:hypothetical protein
MGEPGALERCFPESPDLNWYRGERFQWSGAVICNVMDRFHPDWKRDATLDCLDPFGVMLNRVRRNLPPAKAILARFGYEELVASMTTTIEQSKSDAERLFESISRGNGPILSFGTHLLASGEVRFDPTRVEKVDAHREVHTGIFKIEYSGGTHFHSLGVPTAVVLGEGEFDIRTLLVAAPEEYTVVLDGEEVELVEGVHEFTRSMSLSADGLSVEAMAGTVMAGERGLSFILHR